MKSIIVNGEYFEVINPRKYKPVWETIKFEGLFNKDLETVYNRPSATKQSIWRYWKHWALETDGVIALNVSGGNCNTFSISGAYKDSDGKHYAIYITRDHNRLFCCD